MAGTSGKEVEGYYISARDGDIGHVEDLVVDEDGWMVRYFIVDTKNWWPGRKVLIVPGWIDGISWAERKVRIDRSRKAVRNPPEYDPSRLIDREFETRLYRHHDTPAYWADF